MLCWDRLKLMLNMEEEEIDGMKMNTGTDSLVDSDFDISDATLDISTKQSATELFDHAKSRQYHLLNTYSATEGSKDAAELGGKAPLAQLHKAVFIISVHFIPKLKFLNSLDYFNAV